MSYEFENDVYETLENDKLREIIAGNAKFENPVELEDALIEIQRVEDEITHIRALKQRRIAAYDAKIKENQQMVEILRDAICDLMNRQDKKSLKFPGVGNANLRNVKGKWNVIDEDLLTSHLESLGIDKEAGIERTVKINKSKLNKVLNKLDTNNNLGSFVEREEDKKSLTIKFENKQHKNVETKTLKTVKSDNTALPSNDFDKLSI